MELGCTLVTSINNPNRGDLELAEGGLEVVRTVLADEVAQRLGVRLRFFRGEWFLNLEEGTPYYELILVHGLTDRIIQSVFGQVITGTQGVLKLLTLTHTIDKATRHLSLQFSCQLEDGTTFSTTDYPDFVVVA